jgi:two-component system sensor histidine kinase MtrB
MLRGVRARLALTIVALVVLTAAVLGIASYAFVDISLHDRVKDDAAIQAGVDLSVLIPSVLDEPTREDFQASGLRERVSRRGVDLVADFGDIEPDFTEVLTPDFLAALGRNEIAYQWTALSGQPKLIVGGVLPASEARFYFVHDVSGLESALGLLRLGLGGGALLLAFVALVAARWIARGVLAPVEAASRAAERIELGDYSTRVPVTSGDEFGSWAERFNRMAAALQDSIGRLKEAQSQNRQFVADVSHELRTPLAALVAEASILRDHLDALPEGSRRAGELLITDIARLRILVDDLMEVSRFDAEAEQVSIQTVDLRRLVEAVGASRLPDARLDLPADPVIIETDPRRLERIVGNLLDNAREHAPGSPVEVTVSTSGDTITIAVTDRGPGVAPDRLARIFERFYKADPSRHGGSSGLGLAIAAEHAALLGGELRAANREGGGLRMELRLPVTGSLPGGDHAATPGDEAAIPDRTAQESPR